MRLVTLFFAVLWMAGCAPTADLRIGTPDEPLAPGRLVVIPVMYAAQSVRAEGGVLEAGEFEGEADAAGDHQAAFWNRFVSALNVALPSLEVRLEESIGGEGWVERRALVRGARQGYGGERWTVERVALPDSIAFEALRADYVLFVDRASVSSDVPGTPVTGSFNPVTGVLEGSSTGLGMTASGRMVLFRAEHDAPLLAHTMSVRQSGAGFAKRRLSRTTWDEVVTELAQRVAAASEGR